MLVERRCKKCNSNDVYAGSDGARELAESPIDDVSTEEIFCLCRQCGEIWTE